MTMIMTTYVLIALVVILHLAIAVFLVRKYVRTRDVGFIWLGSASHLFFGLSCPASLTAASQFSWRVS